MQYSEYDNLVTLRGPASYLAIMSEARSLRRAIGALEDVRRREERVDRCRITGELSAENDDLPGWFLESPYPDCPYPEDCP